MIFKKFGNYNPKIDYLVCRSLLSTLPREFNDLRLRQVYKELAEPLELYEKEIVYIKDVLSVTDLSSSYGAIECINAITGYAFTENDLPSVADVEAGFEVISQYGLEESVKVSFAQLYILHANLESKQLIIPYRKCIYKMLRNKSLVSDYLLHMRVRTDKYLKSHDIKYNKEALDAVAENVSQFRQNIGAVGAGVYGSIAAGTSTQYSDLDLLVIFDDERGRKEVKGKSLEYWHPILPIDIDVCAVRVADFEKLPVGIRGTLKMLEGEKP